MPIPGVHITVQNVTDVDDTVVHNSSAGSLGVYLTLSEIIWWTLKCVLVKGQ